MASERSKPSHFERQRVPLESKVSLKFKEFRGFITEYSQNISLGGMFLAAENPQPAGTVFDFEFKLADEFSLIHGIGEVVWSREESADPEKPSGMGVRFLHIDGAGEKLIGRMVQEHVERGGTPFELGTPEDALSPGPPAVALESDSQVETETHLDAREPEEIELSVLTSPSPPPAQRDLLDPIELPPEPSLVAPTSFSGVDSLDETVILTDPVAFGDPDPPRPQAPLLPSTDLPDIAIESSEESVDDSLPPGFDEVARALGKTGPTIRYAPTSSATDASTSADVPPPAAENLGGLLDPISDIEGSLPHWKIPEPVFELDPPPVRPSHRWVGPTFVTAVLLGLAAYYFISRLPDGPAFAADGIDTVTSELNGTADPAEVEPPSDAASTGPNSETGSGEISSVTEDPPSLESLVGLPEPEVSDTQTSPSVAELPSGASGEVLSGTDPLTGAAATLIEDVQWVQTDRTTIVTLTANGTFAPNRFSTFRLHGGLPREVVRIKGIESGFLRNVISVGTPTVHQIRLGHHVKEKGPELHVVFDLQHIDAKLFTVHTEGNQIIVVLGPT